VGEIKHPFTFTLHLSKGKVNKRRNRQPSRLKDNDIVVWDGHIDKKKQHLDISFGHKTKLRERINPVFMKTFLASLLICETTLT
jgi:hypothetical protein